MPPGGATASTRQSTHGTPDTHSWACLRCGNLILDKKRRPPRYNSVTSTNDGNRVVGLVLEDFRYFCRDSAARGNDSVHKVIGARYRGDLPLCVPPMRPSCSASTGSPLPENDAAISLAMDSLAERREMAPSEARTRVSLRGTVHRSLCCGRCRFLGRRAHCSISETFEDKTTEPITIISGKLRCCTLVAPPFVEYR